MRLTWTCARLDDVAPRALYQMLALRSQVFVVEQACVFLDPDGLDLDPRVWQLLGESESEGAGEGDEGALMAGARLIGPLAKGPRQASPMISRVVTAPAGRGLGLGRQLMERAIAECESRWPGLGIEIGAQAHLQDFYASLGFVVTGEPYLEDGIPHVDMRRESR